MSDVLLQGPGPNKRILVFFIVASLSAILLVGFFLPWLSNLTITPGWFNAISTPLSVIVYCLSMGWMFKWALNGSDK